MTETVTKFVPLKICLIDEGRFIGNLNDALRSAQEAIIAHAKKYGHKANKAKASVDVKIVLVCLDHEQESYGCAAIIKISLPAAPPAVSLLIGGETQTGENCLLCKRSGSSKDHPSQQKLCTDDGRSIDQDTGTAESLEE